MNKPLHANRRAFLKSAAGFGALALPRILQWQSASAAEGASRPNTAVIFVQLGGGASHFETYDPKPNAPAEIRGELRPIATAVPGLHFCELLPRQAALMRRLAVVRSITHGEASHIALHMVETGYFLQDSGNARQGEMPAFGSVVSRVRGSMNRGLPSYVSLPPPFAYSGPHYLGAEHAAFAVRADPNAPDFSVPNLSLHQNLTPERLDQRLSMQQGFDNARDVSDIHGSADAMDRFRQQAVELLTGPRARTAFELSREDMRMREQYGRHTFGQRMLLARRLVEAGVPYVVVRMAGWDDHRDLVSRMRQRCAMYDQGMAALIGDLHQRGMDRNVLVVAMGEFGRTPRINGSAGRDHWPRVMSVMLSGGSYRMGQVIGASDSQGASAAHAPYAPQNVLAMAYRHLGIDPALTFVDFSGRPRHILEVREPIRELL